MKSLTGINITDMNTLLQLSGTTQALTQNAMSLSPETQVKLKKLLPIRHILLRKSILTLETAE